MSKYAASVTNGLPERALAILSDLVAFDTTSRRSNIELIEYVDAQLIEQGIVAQRIYSADAGKANLLATIGPLVPQGVVLSGHTDVVPVDGQAWSSDPFRLTERCGRLFGRGTSDMKTFLAVALALVPRVIACKRLVRPVHLAFSYDEEVGCLGAPAMIDALVRQGPPPAAVIIGEPTNMMVVGSHKGVVSYDVTVTGHEAHSSLTHLGLSANAVAVRLMNCLMDISAALEHQAAQDSPFEPKHSTLTIGKMAGGTAVNILSGRCDFSFDLRFVPQCDPDAILRTFFDEIEKINAEIQRQYPGTGITAHCRMAVPAFASGKNDYAAQLAQRLTGDNSLPRAVPFGSEAGQFQNAGLSSIICGPGSIEQAHQPDEYIERDQLDRCIAFMDGLVEHLSVD